MKGRIELSFLETMGQPDRILFFINLPSLFYSKTTIDLTLLNELPELATRLGKKIIPAAQCTRLFEALGQLMQTNPAMFYIETHVLKKLLEKLEKNGYIENNQSQAYKRSLEKLSQEERTLQPFLAKSSDAATENKKCSTLASQQLNVSATSAFEVKHQGMFTLSKVEKKKQPRPLPMTSSKGSDGPPSCSIM